MELSFSDLSFDEIAVILICFGYISGFLASYLLNVFGYICDYFKTRKKSKDVNR